MNDKAVENGWRLRLPAEAITPYFPMFKWTDTVYRRFDGCVVDDTFAERFDGLRNELLARLKLLAPDAMEAEDLLDALRLFRDYVIEAKSIWGGDFYFAGTEKP